MNGVRLLPVRMPMEAPRKYFHDRTMIVQALVLKQCSSSFNGIRGHCMLGKVEKYSQDRNLS